MKENNEIRKEKIDGYIKIDTSKKKEINVAKMSVEELVEITKFDTSAIKSLANVIMPMVNQIDISYINKQMESIGKVMSEMMNSWKEIFDKNFFENFADFNVGLYDLLKQYEGVDKLDGHKVGILSRNYWVMPFEYPYEKINELDKIDSKDKFDVLMLNHFTTRRVQRLFNQTIKNSEKDKRIIMKQIKQNYFTGNYAICVTALVTFLDGLSLEFLDNNSEYQGKSHNVFEDILDYYNEQDITVKGYQEFLQIKLVAEFYHELFDDLTKLKDGKNNKFNRHQISHGAKYINKRVEVLRLTNTILLLQKIIDTTELKGMFEGYKKATDKNRVHYKMKQTN
jgi:uncharacterized protein YacL (UPF0231 family)